MAEIRNSHRNVGTVNCDPNFGNLSPWESRPGDMGSYRWGVLSKWSSVVAFKFPVRKLSWGEADQKCQATTSGWRSIGPDALGCVSNKLRTEEFFRVGMDPLSH